MAALTCAENSLKYLCWERLGSCRRSSNNSRPDRCEDWRFWRQKSVVIMSRCPQTEKYTMIETQEGGLWRYTGDCLQPDRWVFSFSLPLPPPGTHPHTEKYSAPHLWGVEVLKQSVYILLYPNIKTASQSKVELRDLLFVVSAPLASIVPTGTVLPPFLAQGHPSPPQDSSVFFSNTTISPTPV